MACFFLKASVILLYNYCTVHEKEIFHSITVSHSVREIEIWFFMETAVCFIARFPSMRF